VSLTSLRRSAFGRAEGLAISVRGGGHGVAGKAVTDGGLVIDLSPMKGVYVDAAARTVRAQGGVTWGELNRETQLHGLAVTGGTVSTTGIAGLTLGGGHGWMMNRYGLSADNLLSAEIVTADGRVLTASDREHHDLFWALRGAGANFGVVASLSYRLYPVGPTVTAGVVIHPFEAAGELLRFYRELAPGLSDELTVYAGLLHAPDGSGAPLCGLVLCHVGPVERARRDVEPLLAFGSPLDVQVGPMAYAVANTLFDAHYPKGALNHWKSAFLTALSDPAIETIIERFAVCPSPMTLLALEEFHGEVTRIPIDATAVPHRDPGFNLLITSVWSDPAATEANIAWTGETYAALQAFIADRRYVNYLDADDTHGVRAAYGPNYDRLVTLKREYDPDNLFSSNQNISLAG